MNIKETHNIIKTAEGAESEGIAIDPNSHVSMNMWGVTPDIFPVLEKGFTDFLSALTEADIKKEYLLPDIFDMLIKNGKATVKVLETNDKWFGVTYKEDKPFVVESFKKLIADGIYNEKLFG